MRLLYLLPLGGVGYSPPDGRCHAYRLSALVYPNPGCITEQPQQRRAAPHLIGLLNLPLGLTTAVGSLSSVRDLYFTNKHAVPHPQNGHGLLVDISPVDSQSFKS